MANDIFSNKSLININIDSFTVNSGNVSRVNNTLELKGTSRCTFSYSFNEPLQTNKLKITYDIEGNDESTRYNNKIGIQLRIYLSNAEYEEKIVYKDGEIQSVDIMPYKSNEDRGNYSDEIIDLKSYYIRKLDVILYFYSDTNNDVTVFKNINIYNIATITEDNVDHAVQNSIDGLYGQKLSCIDVLDSDPDPRTVPNGVNAPYCYMWILRSALE